MRSLFGGKAAAYWRAAFVVMLIALVVVYILVGLYQQRWVTEPRYIAGDFGIYLTAIRSAQAGESAYYPYDIGTSFLYHPAVLSLLSPLTTLPYAAAFGLWAILSIMAYSILLKPVRVHWGWLVFTLLVFFAPVMVHVLIGQINLFAAVAIFAAWRFSEKGRDNFAGVALAVAIVLKLSPALLLVYFIARRRWQVVTAAVVSVMFLTLIPVLQFGIRPFVDFISSTLQTVSGTTGLSLLSIMEAAGIPAASLLHKLILLIVVCLLARAAWRRGSAFTFALFLLTMILFSPLIWLHHFVFIAVVLAILPLRRRWLPLIVLALVLIQCEEFVNLYPPGILTTLAVLVLALVCWRAEDDRKIVPQF